MLSTVPITVVSVADSGVGTLRDAITQADANTGNSYAINFSVTGTIQLTSPLPDLSNNIALNGPGASDLTVQRDSSPSTPLFSVFMVDSGVIEIISGITISGGNSINGGGINNNGTLTVDNSAFTGNSAGYGGGIFNDNTGTATVKNSTFTGNSAGYGGGIFNDQLGTLTVTNSTFTSSYVNGVGGGLCNFGILTVTDSTFTNNTAAGDGGGGIWNDGQLTVKNSTFINNSATDGGGIANGSANAPIGTSTVTNSTFAHNSATSEGGGIFIYDGDNLTLNDTIVANNTGSGADIDGQVQPTSANNLIGDGTGITNLNQLAQSNLIGTTADPINPLLGPLDHYGGPTQTMALLPGSPAIDAGSNALIPAGVTTDQRGVGFPRIVNGTVDIGAFESSGFIVTVTSGSGQSTGPLTAFSAPLVATVTANNPSEPVAGGLVTLTALPSGASATLSGSPATINATGSASVTAAANSIVGSYTVSATASGITTPASFSLTNMWVPTFSALISPAIVYGTSATTLTGHLGSGTAYPTGSNVSIMLNSFTQTASVDGSGNFTTTFSTGSLGVAGGPYTVTYAFVGNSAFTAATDTSTTLTVTAAPLTASIIGDPTKTYDGTTSARLTQANFSLSGLVGTQRFTVKQTLGTYNSKDVTAATTVMASLSPSDFTPGSGTVASNYILPTTASGAGTITPKALTYSGLSVPASKVYDGTTTAEVSWTAALQAAEAAGTGSTEDGKTYSVDSVSLTGTPTGTYNSKDVAMATTVTFGGLALTGTGNGDYTLTASTQAATITPRTATASIIGDPSKTYNGSTSATLSPSNFSLTGVISGESFTVTQTAGTYNSKDVSTATTVTASLSAGNFTPGSGALASDYTLPTTASGTGNIKAASLTVTATDQSMTYGSTVPALTYTYAGLVNNDTSVVFSGSLVTTATSSSNVGDYPITVGTLAATGNYTIGTFNAGTLTIAKADITISPYDVTYNGNVHNATGTTLTGLVINSAHTNAGIYTDSWAYTDPNGNYNSSAGIITDTIAKATASINVTPYSATYDGNLHTATGVITGVNGVGLSGLTVSSAQTNAGTYADSWVFSDTTGNYNNSSGTITDAIAKANANISVIGYNTFYNAAPHAATGAVYGVNGTTMSGLNLGGTVHTNVGTYADVWTFTDTTGNYNNASGTVVDTITPSKSKMVRETVNSPKTTVVKATVLVPGIKEVKVVERVQVNGKWIKKTVLVPETVMVTKTVLVNKIKIFNKTEMVKVYYT